MSDVVTITFDDGTSFSEWSSLSITENFTNPLGDYTFRVAPSKERLVEFRKRLDKGARIGIMVGTQPIATPIITTVRSSLSRGEGPFYELSCKTILAPATEASADTGLSKKYKTDVPVKDLVLEVLRPFGFAFIGSDSTGDVNAKTGLDIKGRQPEIVVEDLKGKECEVQENDTAYGYCARIFSRLGAALRVDWRGILLLSRPEYDQNSIYDFIEGEPPLIGISVVDTNDNQFSSIVVHGKSVEVAGKTTTSKPVGGAKGKPDIDYADKLKKEGITLTTSTPSVTIDSLVEYSPARSTYRSVFQPHKTKFVSDKKTRDKKRAESLAKMHFGRCAENAYVISVDVAGLSTSNGTVYNIDTVGRVVSPSLGIDDNFWVLEVNFSVDRSGGARTRLKMLPLGALIIGDL